MVRKHDGKHVAIFRDPTKPFLRPEEEIQVEMAEIDAKYPLPHPGFRTGQIWGVAPPEGGVTTLQIVEDYDGGPTDPVHPPGRWFTLVAGSAARLSDTLGDRRPFHVTEGPLNLGSTVLLVLMWPCWLDPLERALELKIIGRSKRK